MWTTLISKWFVMVTSENIGLSELELKREVEQEASRVS